METLYVASDSRLSRDENTLRIDLPDGALRRFPVESVDHVVCLNSFTMTSKLLELCGSSGVRVSFFNHHGVFRGAFEPRDKNPCGAVILRQAAHALDPAKRLEWAHAFVAGSGHNAVNLLKKVLHNDATDSRKGLRLGVAELERRVLQCRHATTVEDLMGREGHWRACYYALWPLVHPGLEMGPRVRRPPNNPINTMVSFLNQMLYASTCHQLAKTHLSPALSFLHSPGAARSSLALDVAEVFRPVAVDRLVFRLVRRNVLNHAWFHHPAPGVCLLTEDGMRAVLDHWRRQMDSGNASRGMTETLRQECIQVERAIMGMAPAYHPYRLRA